MVSVLDYGWSSPGSLHSLERKPGPGCLKGGERYPPVNCWQNELHYPPAGVCHRIVIYSLFSIIQPSFQQQEPRV